MLYINTIEYFSPYLFLLLRELVASNLCEEPTDCPVSLQPMGCFKDKRHHRALPYYIYNERDESLANYGGQKINWNHWENYLPGFICRCAKKAKELGYDLFGVQFFGK